MGEEQQTKQTRLGMFVIELQRSCDWCILVSEEPWARFGDRRAMNESVATEYYTKNSKLILRYLLTDVLLYSIRKKVK